MTAARAGRGFLLPGLVFLFAIDLVPLLYSGWISLYEWWLVRPRDVRFVGLANYVGLAGDPAFRRSIAVTTLFTVGAVLVEFLIGLGLALLFSQSFRFLRPLRVVLLLPLFVVPVVGATMWRVIFHPEMGVLNHYLELVGLGRPEWPAIRRRRSSPSCRWTPGDDPVHVPGALRGAGGAARRAVRGGRR